LSALPYGRVKILRLCGITLIPVGHGSVPFLYDIMIAPDQCTISKLANVDPTSLCVGERSIIEEAAFVGIDVTLGEDVIIRQGSQVCFESFIGDRVLVGPRVRIGHRALIMDDAQICPGDVTKHSTDARKIGAFATIGPGVLLHDEVELGENAIVPTQRTIVSLGNFGAKNRVVTIYGSDTGPLYSVGCQMGIQYSALVGRVGNATVTTEESASTYSPFLHVFNEIGRVVQQAYDAEANLVAELKATRETLIR
jgi:acetyltransferase-like isoleucine patch superfamily enzyme